MLLSPLRVVLEINTDDRKETRIDGRLAWLYNELTRGASFRAAQGLVCVTNELARSRSVARFGRPAIVIGNAGDPGAVEPLAAPARESAAARSCSWATWRPGPESTSCGRCVARSRSWTCTWWAMSATRPALEGLYRICISTGAWSRIATARSWQPADFGIGPLALHRKGMSEATPLKVRDYLMHGLPILIAHDDTDFPGERPWYVLQIPNSEGTIDESLAAIETWSAAVAGRRVPRAEVLEHIGIEAKEQARIAFFEDVVARPRSRRRWRR